MNESLILRIPIIVLVSRIHQVVKMHHKYENLCAEKEEECIYADNREVRHGVPGSQVESSGVSLEVILYKIIQKC